jgi:hypothetical protein
MNRETKDLLLRLAAKYVWWKSPEEAMDRPERIVAQIMNLGDYDDIQALAGALGDQYLGLVLKGSEAGEFDERSWAYWHYRLGISQPGTLPALPLRRVLR